MPLSRLQARHMQGPHELQPHIYSLISPLPTWVQENPKIELLYLVVVLKKRTAERLCNCSTEEEKNSGVELGRVGAGAHCSSEMN